MRIWEIVGDYLDKTKLVEMARQRIEVESKITDLAVPMIKHMIKILKWSDARNYQKHLGDINSWGYDIERLRYQGNRKPTQRDYYTWMYSDNITESIGIRKLIKGMEHKYKKLVIIRTDDEVHDIIKNWLYQMSYDMPLDKFEGIENYMK